MRRSKRPGAIVVDLTIHLQPETCRVVIRFKMVNLFPAVFSMRHLRLIRLAPAFLLALPLSLGAQVLDLTINNTGIAIGDKPRVNGLRINFRDRKLDHVNGANITVWSPYEPPSGVVNGFAIGLPATGAKNITGISVGVLGVGAQNSISGISIGGAGIGSGGELRGIMLGGIGVGSGGGIHGLSLGLIGVGSGGPIRGIQVGAIGVGGGSELSGISIGGIGAGSAGRVSGLAIGGIGVGGGGGITGIGIGGIGVGSGGDVNGLMIGGVGVGSGGMLQGVAIGGAGVGAPRIKGLAIGGLGVGGADVHAIVLTAGYFKIEDRGRFDGTALASVSNIRGAQHGLTIGLFNYANQLHGAQIGLINVSDNGGRRRVLPLLSVR